MPSPVVRMPLSSAIPLRSTTTFGLLDSILEPVEAVEPAGHYPGIRSMLLEKLLRVRDRARLKQIESGHDVSYYCHRFLSN